MQSRPSKKRSEGKRASVHQGQPTWRLAFYLEGLFYAFEMESIVLKRLKGGLQRLQRRFQTKTSLHPATVYPLLDAWSYVDVIHRLRELLRQVPKLKTRDAAVKSFLDETASADHLRRYVQHMRRQTGTTPGPAGPLWGALSWVDSDGGTEVCHVEASGTQRTGIRAWACPYDREESRFRTKLVLVADNLTFDIEAAHQAVQGLRRFMDAWVSCQGYGEYFRDNAAIFQTSPSDRSEAVSGF